MKLYLRLGTYVFCVYLIALAFGCEPNHSQKLERREQASELLRRLDDLHGGYMRGETDYARQSLESSIELIKSSKIMEPSGQAGDLFLEYSRLYLLEKYSNNDAEAEAALIKARFWLLQHFELDKTSNDEAIQQVNSMTMDKIRETIDSLDKGKPKYREQVQK